MYKYCPHCGKPFLEPDKPRTVGIISQVKEFITWAQIKEWSDLREASKHFEIGDEIYDELKSRSPWSSLRRTSPLTATSCSCSRTACAIPTP